MSYLSEVVRVLKRDKRVYFNIQQQHGQQGSVCFKYVIDSDNVLCFQFIKFLFEERLS